MPSMRPRSVRDAPMGPVRNSGSSAKTISDETSVKKLTKPSA